MAKEHEIFYIRNPKGVSELKREDAFTYITENFPGK